MKILKRLRGAFLCFLFCFIIPFLSFVIINNFINKDSSSTFNTGYSLCGVDLGGLTKEQAKVKLDEHFKDSSMNLNLVIKYNYEKDESINWNKNIDSNKTWLFTDKDFKLESNIHTVLDNAYKTNRKGDYFKRIRNLKKIRNMGFSPQVAVRYVLVDIDKKIDEICSDIETEPINAKAVLDKNSDSFKIISGKKGLKVNRDKLLSDIEKGLMQSNSLEVNIDTNCVLPNLKEDDINKALTLQSSFTTNYSKSNSERKNNIKLATNALNGIEIKPNEEFSFNDVIGKRTADRGYKEANIIKDGSFVKGLGGGICQVSTTLYNALLLSNIDVTEAHPHSLPVSYVKAGMDAMVSWGNADLKFKNNTALPIYILGKTDGNNLTFKIYGDTKEKDLEIKTSSEIIKPIPHKKDKIIPDVNGIYGDKIMFKGEYYRVKYPKDGYEVKTYLEYYLNGNFDHKKLIRHATYNSQQGIVYEGTDTLPEGMTLPKDTIIKEDIA